MTLGHRGRECPQPAVVVEDDDEVEMDRATDRAADDDGDVPADPLHHTDSPPRPPPAMMTIVDTTGVHFLPVTWCGCTDAGDHTSQLLDAGLYPASQRKARTCFTFGALDSFLLDNLELPVSDRAEYQHTHMIEMEAKKQFGYGLQWREAPGNGDLAHFCPACPQPGVNIPADWEVDDRKYLYARGYVMDGNFHTEQMKMRKPENDVPLMPGKMFMVHPGPYEEHLKVAKDVKMHSSCNDHKAVSQANANRHKLAVTGIGATSCLRHRCFLPHSVVNYQKGERQMNMDYSLSNALGYRSRGIGHVYVSYDIMCQYHVHLHDRFDDNPYLQMPGASSYTSALASFTFTGAGEADGEIIETQWSGINPVSGSTRSMSTSHRQETLDRHMNNWNWKKMITMVASLRRKIKANRPLLADMKADLTAKEASVDAEILGEYQAKKQIMPSRLELQIKLAEEEGDGGDRVGTADWIADGLKLEEQQLAIQKDIKQMGAIVTGAQELKLAKRRKPLESQIRRFHRRAAAIHRRHDWGVAEEEAVDDDSAAEWEEDPNDPPAHADNPWSIFPSKPPAPYPVKAAEHTKLGLPSNFTRNALTANGLQRLAAHELTLRRGQANDALQQLRILIGKKSFEFQTTIRHGRKDGNKKRTRSLPSWVNSTELYSFKPQSIAGPERRCKCSALTAIAEPNKAGQRHKSPSWIWNVNVGGDIRSNDELGIIHRVQWFHARSKVDRLEEEAAILRRELDSVCRYFDHEACRWRGLVTNNTDAEYPGFSQHCRAQAALFDHLHEDAKVAWRDLYLEPNLMT
ncbi:uncharacterized protein B0H18DRAFT_1132231 [Fomitopsis serialis]|uniref:uncharacterized protein n=1 Tax=Fomitopsis serialis TaxID=139415 RepID=UPI00200875B3|nr:uncharacterized protein B0H18DRAFT_1132231 [Neoantrodia serialis]KAH9905072.1 hypothetical protein B0H18DRAFT_1132231 [Neoantrodia serialis]